MTAPGCADPTECPVPDPDTVDLRHLTSVVLASGTPLRRGHKRRYAADQLVAPVDELTPPTAMSRFAPVVGVAHVHVARREIAALLASALHDVALGHPRIRWPQLGQWALSQVTLRADTRPIDLRDAALALLGLTRENLVAADPGHYPCTRAWADRLHGRHVGGRPHTGSSGTRARANSTPTRVFDHCSPTCCTASSPRSPCCGPTRTPTWLPLPVRGRWPRVTDTSWSVTSQTSSAHHHHYADPTADAAVLRTLIRGGCLRLVRSATSRMSHAPATLSRTAPDKTEELRTMFAAAPSQSVAPDREWSVTELATHLAGWGIRGCLGALAGLVLHHHYRCNKLLEN